MTPIDERMRAFLQRTSGRAMPGSPLELYKPPPAPGSRAMPGSPLELYARTPEPVTMPERPRDELDDALETFDAHKQAERDGTAKPTAAPAVPSIDTRNVEGDYFDDELAPFREQKVREPEEGPDKPNKAVRLLDVIGGAMSGKGYDTRYWDSVDARHKRGELERANAAKDADAKDPNSPASRSAQAKWRPYLKAAGWSDADIGRMSAADMADLNIGDVSDFRVKSRQKADELAARTEREDKLLTDKNTREDKHREEDLKNREAAAEEAAREAELRARIIAGSRAGARTIEHEREDQKLATQAKRDYELKREQAGIPKARVITERLRRNIAAARAKNEGEIFGTQDEVIRRGPKDAWPLMSPESRAIMEDLQLLQNQQIKDTSGAAVTISEMPRVAAAFGTGVFSGEGDLERYIDRYEEELAAVDGAFARAYGQDGTTAPSSPAPRAKPAGGSGKPAPAAGGGGKRVRFTDPNTGKRRIAPNEPKVIEALKAAGVDFEELE